MSSSFKVADDFFNGTNGAVEAYVEAIAAQAALRFGPDNPLTLFFKNEQDLFPYQGRIVILDAWVGTPANCKRFLELLDASTVELLRDHAFTAYGQEWVATVIKDLRSRIARGNPE